MADRRAMHVHRCVTGFNLNDAPACKAERRMQQEGWMEKAFKLFVRWGWIPIVLYFGGRAITGY